MIVCILLKEILRYIIRGVAKLLVTMKVIRPELVILVDGGICSQMVQYLNGVYFAREGYHVEYDTLFYMQGGKDVDGKCLRLFEITEMFPELQFEKASRLKIDFYRKFLKAPKNNKELPTEIDRPMHLCEYYNPPIDKFLPTFESVFNWDSCAWKKSSDHFNITCGVHVRRGDLANGKNIYYGGISEGYFERAIAYVNNKYPQVLFRFFSDDPEYVKNEIMPNLDVKAECVSGNGMKAWEELCALAESDIIIASQGSYGKIAACMNHSELILCDNKYAQRWIDYGLNVKLIK